MPTHTLGDRIQKAREDKGLRQAELARRVGVVTTTAWRWEHDRSAPRPSDLDRLAGVLGVSKEWLETGVVSDAAAVPGTDLAPTGTDSI